MGKITVSVICLTYNQREYIDRCLNSLINQVTTFSFEIIVHDDASNDGTSDIVRKYQMLYPNVVVSVIENENLFSNGFFFDADFYKLVKGDYIAFCEGDDYWSCNTKLQEQYEYMEANPRCSMCLHPVEMVDSIGNRINQNKDSDFFDRGPNSGDLVLKEYLHGNNGVMCQTSSYFVRRDVINNMPECFKDFSVGDVQIFLHSCVSGDILYIDKAMSCYRVCAKGSTNIKIKDDEYYKDRIRRNANGFLKFNDMTNGIYYDDMKRRVASYVAPIYYDSNRLEFVKEYKDLKSSLGLRGWLTARLKFSFIGIRLRNIVGRLK